MVHIGGKPEKPKSGVIDACVVQPGVSAERLRKLESLKKEYPDVDFQLKQTGEVYRSMGESPAQKAAKEANAALPEACDGNKITVVGPKAKAPRP